MSLISKVNEESTVMRKKMESILSKKNELVVKLQASEEVCSFHVGVKMISFGLVYQLSVDILGPCR